MSSSSSRRSSGFLFPPGHQPSEVTVPPPLQFDLSRPVSPGCPSASDFVREDELPIERGRSRTVTLPGNLSSRRHMQGSARPSPLSSVIRPGTYIAFAISRDDVRETLPSDSGEGKPETPAPSQRYIGLVADVTPCAKTEAEEHQHEELITVAFVSTETPADLSAYGDHWLHISPALHDEAVWSQPPLRTNILFPYEGTKQWTTLGTCLNVARVHRSSLSFSLLDAELERFQDISMNHLERGYLEDGAPQELNLLPGATVEVWTDIRMAGRVNSPCQYLQEVAEFDSCAE